MSWKRRAALSLLSLAALVAVGFGVVLVNDFITPALVCDWATRRGNC